MNEGTLPNLLADQVDRADASLQASAPPLPPPVLIFQVGLTMHSPETRNVDPRLFAGGVHGFVEREVLPMLSRFPGSPICVRNPGGCLLGEDMQLDQLLEAKAAGLRWLVDDFVPAWRQVTAMGREVHFYLGWPGNDRDFNRLAGAGKSDDYLRRVERSIHMIANAGGRLVLDVVGGCPLIHEMTGVAIFCRSRMGGCGVEAGHPRREHTHWHDWPGLWATDSWWRRTNPALHADMAHCAGDDMLRGAKVVRMIETPPEGEDWAGYARWAPRLAREIYADGHVPGVYHHWHFRDNPGATWGQFLATTPDPAPTASPDPAAPGATT